MIPARMPPIRRFFQLQIPQMFRPTLSSVLAKTIGHVNLEAPAAGLTAVAYWTRFSRWCRLHPMPQFTASREDLYDSVAKQERLNLEPVTYLEFGVYRGASLKWWLGNISSPESRFVGFDTFTGLPERWRATEPKGWFNALGKVPNIQDPRCSFQAGLFQDTLPSFIKHANLASRLIINLDADMFTSTLFVLTTLAPYLKAGDIVFFDEFSCPLDEYRAFEEFVRSFRVQYRVVGAQYGYTRVCIALL
jgi:O-methyltransferase